MHRSALSAADIAWYMRLHAQGLRHEWITPNAVLYGWESDLLTVTPEGLVCEVEIKISRADLKQDLLKPKHSQGLLLNGISPVHGPTDPGTHRMVAPCRRPNYFCFAMPCHIYRSGARLPIPPYAGVYTVDEEGRVFEERRPIQLHTERIRTEDLLWLARRMHDRYWNELRRMKQPGTAAVLMGAKEDAHS
jgi:hypothetical protein